MTSSILIFEVLYKLTKPYCLYLIFFMPVFHLERVVPHMIRNQVSTNHKNGCVDAYVCVCGQGRYTAPQSGEKSCKKDYSRDGIGKVTIQNAAFMKELLT